MLLGCERVPQTTAATTIEPKAQQADELYDLYFNRIQDGLTEFRKLINSSEDFGPVSTLDIEYRTVFGISTEGARFTRFMTPEDRIVRYTLHIFGETFRAEENYYFFSDGLIYIQSLRMDYADWSFSIDNRWDILQYTLESYVVDDTKIFYMNDLLKQATEPGKIHFYTLDELNDLFNDGTQEKPAK
jgi:hypothetical protein